MLIRASVFPVLLLALVSTKVPSTGTLTVHGGRPGKSPPTLFAAARTQADPRHPRDRPSPEILRVEPSSFNRDDEKPSATFRLPPGKYGVAIDSGAARPVFVAEVEVVPGTAAEVELKEAAGRDLSILVRGRETGTPLRGATLNDPDQWSVRDRALVAALNSRAGPSGADGLLKLGIVPAEEPVELQVRAEGRRVGRVKLAALFEAGKRTVDLAPKQDLEVHVSGLTLKKDDPRPDVSLSRCRLQGGHGSCLPENPQKRPLGPDNAVRFPRVEGGFYQVALRMPEGASTRADVQVASDSDADDVRVVELQALAWTLRGTTRLRDWTPVEAKVVAVEFIGGLGEGRAAETWSGPDGSFEMTVFSAPTRSLGLYADSEDPPAKGSLGGIPALSESKTVLANLDVELDATGVRVTVRDSRTGRPVADCGVSLAFDSMTGGGARSMTLMTKADGIASEFGLADGVVQIGAKCEGYAPKPATRVEIVPDELRDVEVLVEKAEDFTLVVLDVTGRPLPGAKVLGLASELYWYESWGRGAEAIGLGVTDDAGELLIGGNQSAGRPYFVLAPGRAMAMGVFPPPSTCDTRDACRTTVRMQQRSAFAGLSVKSTSGKLRGTREVYLSKGGIPIPHDVIAEAWSVSGEPARAGGPAGVFDEGTPSLFEEGSYLVRTFWFERPLKASPVLKPIGTVTVPSYERVELIDPTDFPSKK